MSDPTHSTAGLPVPGYRPQNAAALEAVTACKEAEERVLRLLDQLAAAEDVHLDPRWFAIGRTAIEQGFMAINRSVFKPTRISLPEDSL